MAVPGRPVDGDVQPEPEAAADATTGVTTFTPTGTFGLFSGDGTDVNFSDDGLNIAHTTCQRQHAGAALPARHARLPGVRARARAIPNTYIVGIDLSRVPSYKNNDYQDVILLVRNAARGR